MAIENQIEETKLSQEKNLDEVIQEYNLNLTPEEVSEKIALIKEIHNYQSNEAAEEYLKQSIIKCKDLDQEISKHKNVVKNNYSVRNLQTLESLVKKEKQSFNALMKPFIGEKELVPEKNAAETLRLIWYRFMGMGKRYNMLYNELEKRTKVNYFVSTKKELESKKQEVERLAGLHEQKYNENRKNFKYYYKKLKDISNTLEERIKTKKRLEFERDELEKSLDSQESDNVYEEIEDHYYRIDEDIENIEEECINLYEISNNDSITIVEKKREIYLNKEFKKFYKDINRKYARYVDTISKLVEKIKKGMSYEKAYEVAKAFHQNEGIFGDYENIRKGMLENTEITIDLKTTSIPESIPNVSMEKKKNETLYMESSPDKINVFLKKIRKI